jgi:hypothetical protein
MGKPQNKPGRSHSTRRSKGSAFGSRPGGIRNIVEAEPGAVRDSLLSKFGDDPLIRERKIKELHETAGLIGTCTLRQFEIVVGTLRSNENFRDGEIPDEVIVQEVGGLEKWFVCLEACVDLVPIDSIAPA